MIHILFNFRYLLLMFVFFGNNLFAQEPVKKYPSLLWEISGPGMAKPSYVYGTMHVSSKLAFHLGDSFFMALSNCDVVALESDPSQWLKQMLDSSYLEANGGLYRGSSSYSDFYHDAFGVEEVDRRMISSSLNISGRMMNGMLYRHSSSNTDFEEDTYLDMYIFQAGKKWNKTVIGLEDFMESERMVRLSQLPDEDEEDRQINKDYRKMLRSGKRPVEQMEDAYRNEDLDMVDSIQRIMNPSKNHQKYMLQLRNEIMANGMDSIIKLNKSIFSGIGAAHLAGELGVIELLRAKGYTVRPITRVITERNKNYRETLEKTYITHPLTTFNTADGWISAKLPANLVELPSNGDYKIYLYPDMANGTIYSLVRLKHHIHLLNQTQDYIIKRIDSLLYENIPGKIITQKEISQNGYPGFDILNRSKKGDYERYKILVTPIEIVIFKVGGTLDYLKDNENLDAVFNTFQIQSNPSTWQKVESTFGFEIDMPGRPFLEEKNKSLELLLPSDVQILAYNWPDEFYSIKRVGLHDYSYIEEDSFELSYLASEFNTSLHLETISRSWDTVDQRPALRISAKDTGGYLHALYVIDGPRYYQILAKTSDSTWPAVYFNSFKITQAQYKTATLFEDSTVYYSVYTTTKPAGWSSFKAQEANLHKKKKEDTSYLGRSITRTYFNIKSDEQVSVEFTQFSKYYFCPSYDSIWRLQKEEYLDRGLQVKSMVMSRDSNVCDLTLADTNSNRVIVIKYILNNGVLYTLRAVTKENSLDNSPFLSQFWSTFKMNTDTIIGLPFNQNKADVYLSDLLKGDSLTQVHAINSVYHVGFENHHVPQLIDVIESYKNPEFELENRIYLIEKLGTLKHKFILPYLNTVYQRSIDTPQLQMAVLQALVYHKSNAANKQFKELLDSETPLVNEYMVGSLFSSMYDSLELYKDMFPFLLRFTPYPEYKFNLYRLMATMLDSGVIKPMKYRKYKKELVREAKDALKRSMANGMETDLYDDEYGIDMGYDEMPTQSHIWAFNSLLIPFKSDKNVQTYFDRTKRIKSKEDLFLSNLLFLKEGIKVNDTIWAFYANNDDYRIRLYNGLMKLNKLTLMPDSTKTQEMMAKSLLYNDMHLAPNDSIHLVRKLTVESKKGKGYLYVFKRKDEYNDKLWNFDVIGTMPEDTAIIPSYCETKYSGYEYIDDEEMDKKLGELLVNIKYKDRKRVKTKGRRYDDSLYGY